MQEPENYNLPKMSAQAAYRIIIHGWLDPAKSSSLEGMTVQKSTTEESHKTTLTGKLADQAALLGVLSTLYEWHYPIISVEHTLL